MELDTATPSTDGAPPPGEVDSAFIPTEGEARSIDRETYDGAYRSEHADPRSAATELIRKRKEAEQTKAASDALRESVADSDIEEVSYLPGREPDGDLSPLKASRDLRDFRQQKAEAQQNQLRALLNELSPDEPQPGAELAQQPEAQQQQPAEQASPEAVEITAAQHYTHAAQNYSLALTAMLLGGEQDAKEFNDIRSMEDLQRIAATDPARSQRFQESARKHQALAAELAKVRSQQQQVAHAQYQHFASQHDRYAEELIPELRKNADPTVRRNLQQASQDILREAGFSDAELLQAWHNGGSFHLRDARAQKILADAARWRLAQARMKEAVRKPVPPVQRPGTRDSVISHSEGELNAISQRLTRSGSIKDAVQLRKAMLAQRNNRS
jgi:hypothetical protein